jgi:LmbE family N-acetylglucosaminyl deacetylase
VAPERDPNRVLVIGAHPDDIDFGCSGTVARWTRQGRQVDYCLVTSGEKGFEEDLPLEERIRIREEEQLAAARLLGVREVIFLREPDGEVAHTLALRGRIVETIRRTRPEAVLCADPAEQKFDNFYRYHPDHRAVAGAVYDALYPACGNRFFYPHLLAQGLLPHRVAEVFFGYLSAEANFYVDISETIDLKIQALACHRSQLADWDGMAEAIREWARKVGEPKSIPFAEAYRRIALPEG